VDTPLAAGGGALFAHRRGGGRDVGRGPKVDGGHLVAGHSHLAQRAPPVLGDPRRHADRAKHMLGQVSSGAGRGANGMELPGDACANPQTTGGLGGSEMVPYPTLRHQCVIGNLRHADVAVGTPPVEIRTPLAGAQQVPQIPQPAGPALRLCLPGRRAHGHHAPYEHAVGANWPGSANGCVSTYLEPGLGLARERRGHMQVGRLLGLRHSVRQLLRQSSASEQGRGAGRGVYRAGKEGRQYKGTHLQALVEDHAVVPDAPQLARLAAEGQRETVSYTQRG
jgi:hypothetical protein